MNGNVYTINGKTLFFYGKTILFVFFIYLLMYDIIERFVKRSTD